ncbi:MAG: penicillin-binding protein 2, partial [Elusimicrobiota bacterium]
PRGVIYDRNGVIICENKPVVTAIFYPFMSSRSEPVLEDLINRVEKVIPLSRKKIIDAMRNSTAAVLKENLTREETFRILEQQRNLKGLSVITAMKRYYPFGEYGSHFLGYIGEISQQELNEPKYSVYRQGDWIGKTGIEAKYDSYIRGIDGGIFIESDAGGRQTRVVEKIEPIPGNKLLLTVDMELQNIAEAALSETGRPGAIVGIDPSNGAIRVLVSQPGFDPNKFITSQNEVTEYLENKDLPLYNRATQAQYPPGSVFKVITAASALNEDVIKVEQKFNCPGYFVLGRRTFKCWEEKGHKIVSFIPGVVNSCDVYFYNVGLKTGIDNISSYAEKFHLGAPLKIDLPSENPGFIPDAKWRKATFPRGWVNGDTANVSIGQGYLTVTPLQCATLAAVIASRGKIFNPYLVERILDKSGNKIYEKKPTKITEIELKKEVWDVLQSALEGVVERGTGYASFVIGFRAAGKTGTVQNPHGKDHAWFIAYGPVENPQIALSIIVEGGGKGGSVAAPIAKKIFSGLKNEGRRVKR